MQTRGELGNKGIAAMAYSLVSPRFVQIGGGAVNEALVVDELWTTQKRAQLAPEPIGLEADQVEPTAIAGAVGVDDRVR